MGLRYNAHPFKKQPITQALTGIFMSSKRNELSNQEIKHFRRIGHGLNPVVMLGNNGITDGVIEEVVRALHDHELIKIKVIGDDREERQAVIQDIAKKTNCIVAQTIGKVALLYKKNPKANPKLSNIARFG